MAQDININITAKNATRQAFDEVRKSVDGTQDSLVPAAKAGLAFGAAFGVAQQAAVKFIDAGIAAARAIGELAAQAERISNKALITGFSTEAVQQLDRLATNAGVSGDAVFRAVSKMQRAAVEASPGFVKLGLDAQKFGEMLPQEQLQAVAERIMALPTAGERAAAAMKLLGRSGAELLPVFAELADGSEELQVTLSEDQVDALSELDDALDNAKGAFSDLSDQILATIATSPEVTQAINDIATSVSWLAGQVKEGMPGLQAYVALLSRAAGLAGANSPIGLLRIMGIAAGGAPKPTTPTWGGTAGGFPMPALPSANERAEEAAVFRRLALQDKVFRKTSADARKLAAELEALDRKQIEGAMKVEEAELRSLENLDKAAAAHANFVMGEDEKAWSALEKMLNEEEALSEKVRQAEIAALDEKRKHREALGQTFGGLSTVFGSIREGLVAMGVQGDSALMRITVALQTAASAASGFFSAMARGDTLGMIGSAIGGVVGALSALGIGGNKAVMQVNDLRDAFFKAQGGFVEFQKKLVGLTDQDLTKKIFDAKTVDQYNAAVAEAMALIDGQAKAQQELQAAVEKYGFTIEELGPKFAQQELDKQAAQLMKEFQLLTAAGIDVNNVIGKMGPTMVEFVNTSIAAGASIPKAMRPMVDELIKSGQLLDANGKAFGSAEEAGITFAETLTESMQNVIEEIRKLVAALTGIPAVTIPVRYQNPGPPPRWGGGGGEEEGPGGGDGGEEGMARGGIVLPFVPRAAQGIVVARPGGRHVLVGEGGQAELVAPVAALADRIGRAAAAAAGGGSGQVIQVVLDGRVLAEAMVRRNKAGLFPIAASSVRGG